MIRLFKPRYKCVSRSGYQSRVFAAALFIVFSASLAWAQATNTGTVSGQVTDPQGAAIAGAEIKLIDVATSTPHVTDSNQDGRYTFVNVEPGTYNIEVGKAGFALSKVQQQKVDVGLVLTINVTLQLGSTSTTVEVQAQAGAELQTSNASVGSTITGQSITLLPNLGRDANAFVLLQPGVSPLGNVSGAVNDQNAYQLDGGGNSDDMAGNQTTYTPGSGYIGASSTGGTPSGVIPTPAESIEEFRVGTTNNTADFNGSAGGQIQMVTKRGTNQIHGSLYEYYLGSNFGANFWKNNHTPDKALGLPYTPLPSSHQNRFGMSLGGPVLPNFLGGKWYLFGDYEGRRFPQNTTIEKTVPSALLRAGVIQIPTSSGTLAYNVNPYPVTVNGKTYAACGGANYCDPRGLGLNPIVNQIWSKFMPQANDFQAPSPADNLNTQGYISSIALPQNSDFGVVRLDHDFGSKNHFMSSYHMFDFTQAVTSQIDIGGVLSGDTFGNAASQAIRPQKPWLLVMALTSTLTPNMTNDVHVSYLRNYWQWFTAGGPPQPGLGLGGAVEIGGESSNALIPLNVDSQDARQRFWDGKDKTLRDDLSWLKGNHLLQFGGQYQRNFDYHQRNDNGAGIFAANVYQVSNGAGINYSNFTPSSVPSTQASNWDTYYSEVLGLVSQSQTLYTRSGTNLALQPLGTYLYDQDIIPSYDLYFSDTWHMRKDLTVTYGLSWNLEMPPYEVNGKQVELTDTSGHPITAQGYLSQVQQAALAGQPNAAPEVAFTTIKNVVGGSNKYPYNPFYKSFSPRVSAAWNPNFSDGFLGMLFGQNKTVIRGGYGRIYGRLNGVDLVLVPLLGTGLAQAVSCPSTQMNGTCLSSGTATPANAFRIGTDGLSAPLPAAAPTIPQPYVPGVGANVASGDGSVLDPSFKPNHSDQFDFTIQRALSEKVLFEAGYIGRRIRDEYQGVELNAVPTMYTLNGESFAQAFAGTYTALCGLSSPSCANVTAPANVPVQPFFEGALGGANSAYCAGYGSCTAAVATKLKSNIASTQVFSMWQSMATSPSWTLGRTLLNTAPNQLSNVFMETSLGYGNYNALFFSITARNYHGFTATSNFTWSRSLGTGDVAQATSELSIPNPWNVSQAYGPQLYDFRFVYNLNTLYQIPFMSSQKGIVGRLLGGWSIAPLFTAQSGAPLEVNIGTGSNTDCQSFGEVFCNGSASTYENAVTASPLVYSNSAHSNVTGTNGIATAGNASAGGSGINLFSNPVLAYGDFRRLVLGLDTNANGTGVIRGFPSWNLDLAINKDFVITERFRATFIAQFSNVLNHFQPANPTGTALSIDSPSNFGVVTAQATAGTGGIPAMNPRQIEFGLRIHF